MRICAVIPAAGRGTRLGMDIPKILVPTGAKQVVWDVLRDLLLPHVEHIHVVLSPHASPLFDAVLKKEREPSRITTSIQQTPVGMGDAIFGSHEFWSGYDAILIVWGDQVNLSHQTIKQVTQACRKSKTVVLPLTRQENPYVQYDFEDDRLVRVRQSREHEPMDAVGSSDVGAFALSVEDVSIQWQNYLKVPSIGSSTGEINFTPFMVYLSRVAGWQVTPIMVPDVNEARGINTLEDLNFAKSRLAALCPTNDRDS